jgi:hypothetical protein
MSVCTVVDDFIRDKVRWVAVLSNGEIVYEDDGRPGEDPPSAWIRLREYCSANVLFINNMRLQFRSHIVPVGEGYDAFYFVKSVFGVMGSDSVGAYIAGYLDRDGLVHVKRWRTPELVEIGSETRVFDPESLSVITRRPINKV